MAAGPLHCGGPQVKLLFWLPWLDAQCGQPWLLFDVHMMSTLSINLAKSCMDLYRYGNSAAPSNSGVLGIFCKFKKITAPYCTIVAPRASFFPSFQDVMLAGQNVE